MTAFVICVGSSLLSKTMDVTIVKVQVTWPRTPMSSPDAFLTNGWHPVSRSLRKDTYAE